MSRPELTQSQTSRDVGCPSKTYDYDKNEKNMRNESAEFDTHKTDIYDVLSEDLDAFKDAGKLRMEDTIGSEDFNKHVGFRDINKNEKNMRNESAEFDTHKMDIYDVLSQDLDAFKDAGKLRMEDTIGSEHFNKHVGFGDKDTAGDLNIEVPITTEDIMRAGGFGTTDDISSLLPAAIDSTDFEASLRDAWDFEEPQGETPRPGLGWTGFKDSEDHSLA